MGDLIVRVCKGFDSYTIYVLSTYIYMQVYVQRDRCTVFRFIGVLTGPHLKVDEKFHDIYLIGCEVFRSTILTYHMNSQKMVPSF